MTDELPWLTLTDAAERTGQNRETLRSRARRGLLNSRKGNAGQLLVQLPGNLTEPTGAATAPDQGITELVTDLQDEVTELRDRVTRAEAATEIANGRVRDLERLIEDKAQAKDEVIAELKAMLAEARRPWWRRLLG